MYLLHTSELNLYEFFADDIPDYAILSHTWGLEEVSFRDLMDRDASELDRLAGYSKYVGIGVNDDRNVSREAQDTLQEEVVLICRRAPYAWIGTCCIDKSSSAELNEAINSMFQWYRNSQMCYAYLVDVSTGPLGNKANGTEWKAFRQSRWFTRGWTLQELIAPKQLKFYDQNWREFGTKLSLADQISRITGIEVQHFTNDFAGASIAQKMSWMSKRTTTRVEDIAYGMLGILDINMSLHYGSGMKAFLKLQQKIVKGSDDESIFAWTDPSLAESGIFAQSPAAFAGSGDVVKSKFPRLDRPPYTVTNRGLAIELFLYVQSSTDHRSKFPSGSRSLTRTPLHCARQGQATPLAIQLKKVSQCSFTDFVRSSPESLSNWHMPLEEPPRKLAYIRPIYTPVLETKLEDKQFFIPKDSLIKKGFSISTKFPLELDVETTSNAIDPFFERGQSWKVALKKGQNLAAVFFERKTSVVRYNLTDLDYWIRFGLILRVSQETMSWDIVALRKNQTFEKVLEPYLDSHYHWIQTQESHITTLEDNSRLYVSAREKLWRNVRCDSMDITIEKREFTRSPRSSILWS
ncbi:MAG: hypothetical protein ALECFALPRED_004272 [Alectoria fallacina]|uniref:Heterokaryon incompatibility domain-containing protein n=1 Tax=Alectoria fallacina TaxID=1903189 RepID=A0A8H3FU95_9LECA|nr:MAG: hypothetical protein ALECFALPRED_004272 [Alectoria fallacina]